MQYKPPVWGHLLTLFTILIWGVTFISTKILLREFAPVEILLYRFCIGLALLVAIHPSILKPATFRLEILFAGLGITGVVLYFLMENSALRYTQAANVGLVIAAAPVLTALLAHWTTQDEKLSAKLIAGFGVAFFGVFLVIYNGRVVLRLNPQGDILAVLAALTWALYSVLLKKTPGGLNPFYVTGRSFIYSVVLTVLLVHMFGDDFLPAHTLRISSLFHLLFLGLVASAVCYVTWNQSVRMIGAVKANNYIYFIPLITMITSVLVLHERVNLIMILGGVSILTGVYIGQKGFFGLFSKRNSTNSWSAQPGVESDGHH